MFSCQPCKEDRHEKCVTRDIHAKETKCKCGCVGNPYVGIVCAAPGKRRCGDD